MSTGSEVQALIDYAALGLHDANATRYLSGIGLVLVLYDHLLTFEDEVRLVWRAKPSFAKNAFLINRYLVAGVLIGVAYFMNHFTDSSIISNLSCRRYYAFSSLAGVSSISMANMLVLLRVVMLWDRSRRIVILLMLGLLVSFCATFSLMVIVLVKTLPNVYYQSFVHMCVTTVKVKELPGVWASPMFFEILVLLCVCWNAIDRPRETALTRVLQRDGITFFTSLSWLGHFPTPLRDREGLKWRPNPQAPTIYVLRTCNLVLAVVARPTMVLVGVFFVWAMTTLILNRSLLNIQRAATARVTTDSLRTQSRGLSVITSKDSSVTHTVREVRATGSVTGHIVLPASSSRSQSPFGIEPPVVDLEELMVDDGIEVSERIWDTIEMRQR